MIKLKLSDLSLQNIAHWPPYLRVYFSSVIIILMGILFTCTKTIPSYQHYAFLRAENHRLQGLLEDQKRKISEKKQYLLPHKKQNPLLAMKNIPFFLSKITKLSVSTGLWIADIEPVTELKRKFYLEKEFHIVFKGHYESALHLFERLAQLKNPLGIQQFSIRLEEGNSSLLCLDLFLKLYLRLPYD